MRYIIVQLRRKYPSNYVLSGKPGNQQCTGSSEKRGKEPEIWDTYENALKGNTEFRSFLNGIENKKITRMNTYVTTEIIRTKTFYNQRSHKRFFPDFSDLRVRRNPQRYVIQKILKSLNSTNYHKEKNVTWL